MLVIIQGKDGELFVMKRFLHGAWKVSRTILIVLFLIAIGLSGGIFLDRQVLLGYLPANQIPEGAQLNFKLMAEAWNLIQQDYVDRSAVQPQQLTYGAIDGMVNALGDTGHSRFLTPQMVKQEQSFTNGNYEGVGIEIQMKNNQIVIVAPLDNTPAQRAGIQAGEIILKIDGKDISGYTLDQVVKNTQGPAGTQVTLTVQDPKKGTTRDVTLTRAKIAVQNVTWRPIPGTTIADLRISAFSSGVSDDTAKALRAIQDQHMTGVILDLRNDPGGLLDEAVGVSSQFLKSGNVVLEKDAQGQITPVPVKSMRVVNNLPMVVLVNEGTASAAEIVTAALQDANRATVVGATTFGTGTVLNEFPLSDGSALFLATLEWLTPNGQTIWHNGISPNVAVQLPADVTYITPDLLKGMTTAQMDTTGDAQFLKALSLIGQSTAHTSSILAPSTITQSAIEGTSH
jgi:carboxyl-terminal processing protease